MVLHNYTRPPKKVGRGPKGRHAPCGASSPWLHLILSTLFINLNSSNERNSNQYYIKSFTIFWCRWRWRSNHHSGCNHHQNWLKNFLRLTPPRTGLDCRLSFAWNALEWEKRSKMGYTCSSHNIFNKFTRFVHYLNKPNISQPYESKTQKLST